MELTPQMVREIEFRLNLRGYDPDEVDAYLELVSNTISSLQGQLAEAKERAEAAEARAATASTSSETEDTLRRTLVLAQRTADAAIAEANETAAATVGEARHTAQVTLDEAAAEAERVRREADQLAEQRLADATVESSALRTEAEAEARRVVEATRRPLIDEIRELEQIRAFLVEDVGAAETHLATQRAKLEADLAEMSRLLDEPDALRIAPLPELSGAALGEIGDLPIDSSVETDEPQLDEGDAVELLDDDDAAADAADELSESDEPDEPVVVDGADDSMTTMAHEFELDDPVDVAGPGSLDDEPLTDAAPTPVLDELAPDDEIDRRGDAEVFDASVLDEAPEPDQALTDRGRSSDFEGLFAADEAPDDAVSAAATIFSSSGTGEMVEVDSQFDLASGEPVVVEDSTPAPSGDAFLDELRRAVDDDDALDEDNPAIVAFFEDDEGGRSRSRFGRRR